MVVSSVQFGNKNAGSKRTSIQQKRAMITKRFGITDQGEKKL